MAIDLAQSSTILRLWHSFEQIHLILALLHAKYTRKRGGHVLHLVSQDV